MNSLAMSAARYPFSAIVGHDELRLALLLTAVHPAIGGVLIRGEKGTAKSTAVRALAPLLPAVIAWSQKSWPSCVSPTIATWSPSAGTHTTARPG